VELLADRQVAARLDEVVIRLCHLSGAIEPVALDTEILARHAAELAGDLRLAGQHVELERGVGEAGERLPVGDHRAVLHQQLLDLPARQDADQRGDARRDGRADRQVIGERRAADRVGLDVGGGDVGRSARRQDAPQRERAEDQRHHDPRRASPPPAGGAAYHPAVHRGSGQSGCLCRLIGHHGASVADHGLKA
jgi:hypothetical protein